MLEVRGISKAYPGVQCLRGVDLGSSGSEQGSRRPPTDRWGNISSWIGSTNSQSLDANHSRAYPTPKIITATGGKNAMLSKPANAVE